MIELSKGCNGFQLVFQQQDKHDIEKPLVNGLLEWIEESVGWNQEQVEEGSGVIHVDEELPKVLLGEMVKGIILLVVDEPQTRYDSIENEGFPPSNIIVRAILERGCFW